MKTILDKSVRDAMPLSLKLMLGCLVVFALSHFLPYSYGETLGAIRSQQGSSVIINPLSYTIPAGTGWELNPNAWVSILVAFVIYLADPDENIPFFKHVGWWLTPFVLLVFSITGYEAIGMWISLLALGGMLVAALIHLLEQRAARKPPAAPAA